MEKGMKFGKNDEAVSPVIGVILMVAITVILAAVIAAFVFGMGPPAKTAQASLAISSTSTTTSNITIEHRGGDVIDLNKVKGILEQGTNRQTISALANSAQTYGVGDKLVINTNTGSGTGTNLTKVALNNVGVSSTFSPTTGGANFTLATGKVTVTLIDIDSAQQLAKMDATVT